MKYKKNNNLQIMLRQLLHLQWKDYMLHCYTEHSRISVAYVCTFYIQQNYNNLSARKEKLLTFFCNLMTEVHFFSKSPAYFLSTSSFY